MDNCKVCGQDFKTTKNLHHHLRHHKILVKDYYHQFYPREDLYTGAPIIFKTKEQYFATSFNSREHMNCWIAENSNDLVGQFCKSVLLRRKKDKNLIWAPTEVELLSAGLPSISTYNAIFHDYYRFAHELGFKTKHSRFNIDSNKLDYTVYIDTREQKPLVFDRSTEFKALKFGDYTSSIGGCCIERKSLSDFVGTMSKNYERFRKEIERSEQAEAGLVIVVESTLEKAMQIWNYNFTKCSPDFIFHRTRELLQNYPSIQFLFVNGREEASRVICRIFESSETYRFCDLQFIYNKKTL